MSTGTMTGMDDSRIQSRHTLVSTSRTFLRIVRLQRLSERVVLDVGCGYGEYLALFAKGSVGITTTRDEAAFGARNGLDIRIGNAEALDSLGLEVAHFQCAWANNLFEHILAPHAFLMHLKTVLQPDGTLILGVPVLPRLVSLLRMRRFRGALASNHISFFTRETLRLTVERAGWKVQEVRPYLSDNAFLDYMLSFIAPHMYVVAKNDAKFKYPVKKYTEWEGEAYYQPLLGITKQDTLGAD